MDLEGTYMRCSVIMGGNLGWGLDSATWRGFERLWGSTSCELGRPGI